MSLTGKTLGFIGGGIMGAAITRGLLGKGLITPEHIIIAEPYEARGRELVEQFGVRTTTNNLEAAQSADVLVLSVKPQVLSAILPHLKGNLKPDVLVISIIAGTPIRVIADGLGTRTVVRSMPNTPGQIGQGITVWTCPPHLSDVQRQQAEMLLGALGETLYADDEKFLDMATALSGSGPGFVFLFIESLIDAGVHLGFSRNDAERLVLQTVRGSVEYAVASRKHPAQLRNEVTSSGGTTAEGLYQLEKGGLRTIISKAIFAAFNRSVTLGSKPKTPPDVDTNGNS